MPRNVELQNDDLPFEDVFRTTGINHQMQSVIEDGFTQAYKQAASYAQAASRIHVKGEDDEKSMLAAAGIHKKVRELRLSVEKTRKSLKDESLRTGQAIDAAARKIKGVVVPVETAMQEAATYAERMRAERMAAIEAKRVAQLDALEWDHTSLDLQTMSEEQYARILSAAKSTYQEILEERERERIVQLEEAERLRIENENLRKQAEENRKVAEREAKLRREAEDKAEAERQQAAQEAAQRVAVSERGAKQRQREQARIAALGDVERVREYIKGIQDVAYPEAISDSRVAEALANFDGAMGDAIRGLGSELDQITAVK